MAQTPPLPIRDGLNPTHARVPEAESGITAWDFVMRLIDTQRHKHPEEGAAAVDKRFENGQVRLRDGRALTPGDPLKAGWDVYFYRTPAPEEPVPYDIVYLYEDENLLVVDKPPFLATMPRASHITETATVRVRRETGNAELSPAHRLDRLTSGVLVFTKRRQVRGVYQQLFATREVAKTYEAVGPALDLEPPLTWRSRMTKVPGEIQGHIEPRGEVNAVTDVVETAPITAAEHANIEAVHGPQPQLMRYFLQPHTGKTHQLRLHLWDAGAPILGDPVYPVALPLEAEDMRVPMHLTARQITINDPLSGQIRTFRTDLEVLDRI